jgi:hypothetical protein
MTQKPSHTQPIDHTPNIESISKITRLLNRDHAIVSPMNQEHRHIELK